MKKEKMKKGDKVRLNSSLGLHGIIGKLQKWEYHKETGVFVFDIAKDEGGTITFMGRKGQFSVEKYNQ